ncbi:hypothetical protein QQS21_003608 [Conoideocrella luteorostrata]|uniref:CENP-V/GFA domain-containing protein n=1 Tax=Conoideocrella luteorostrata TaxID=1105319 RepID=A0AAJ0CX41_9HYPO|nr:hypothetical protein QQS21_003608 [Conoideocrella luteorostrata]
MKKYAGHPGELELDQDWMRSEHVGFHDTAEQETLKGRCHCGGVEFEVTRPSTESEDIEFGEHISQCGGELCDRPSQVKFMAELCVCDSCRLASGCEIMAWALIPHHRIRSITGEPILFPPMIGSMKRYTSSSSTDRYFCGGCGAVIFCVQKAHPRLLSVAVGVLDATSGARVTNWLDWNTKSVAHSQDGLNRALLTADLIHQKQA